MNFIEIFKQAQHKATHILPSAWISHNRIFFSHTFRHKQNHTHIHAHIQGIYKLPDINLFDLSTLDSAEDRTGPPHPMPAEKLRQAVAVFLLHMYMKFPEVKEALHLGLVLPEVFLFDALCNWA